MKTQKEINAMIDRGEYDEVIEIAVNQGLLIGIKAFAAKCTLINIEQIEKYYNERKYEYKRILLTVIEISKNNYVGSRDCSMDSSMITKATLYDIHETVDGEYMADSIYHVISAALDYGSAKNSVESFYESAIDASVNEHIKSAISKPFQGISAKNFYIQGFITKDDNADIIEDIGDSIHIACENAREDRKKSILERNANHDAAVKRISKSCDSLKEAARCSVLSAIKTNPSCEPKVKQYLKEVFE